MWCNQIFSLINENKIQNIIVCDNYEVASQIARITYGENSLAVDTTLYPVSIGDDYIDGIFYHENTVVNRNLTEEERVTNLETQQTESEIDVDLRLSLLELGLA